jgi:uncharacterized lipoprotein YajG
MKMLWVALSLVLLAGCATPVPITPKFPTPPDVLMASCGPLNTIDKESVLLSEFLQTVRGNYEKYHNCADLVVEWQKWYQDQKNVFEINNK